MYDEPKVKPMAILVYLLVFLALIFGLYILYHDSNDVTNDKALNDLYDQKLNDKALNGLYD